MAEVRSRSPCACDSSAHALLCSCTPALAPHPPTRAHPHSVGKQGLLAHSTKQSLHCACTPTRTRPHTHEHTRTGQEQRGDHEGAGGADDGQVRGHEAQEEGPPGSKQGESELLLLCCGGQLPCLSLAAPHTGTCCCIVCALCESVASTGIVYVHASLCLHPAHMRVKTQ